MSKITFKFRIKDRGAAKHLDRLAVGANQVWNFCVATQREAESRRQAGSDVRWPTAFDFNKLTSGADLGIHSDTMNETIRQFTRSRNQYRRCPRFRASRGAKRALGWVPFVPRAVKLDGDAIVHLKRRYRFWKSREMSGDFKTGAFVEDARGRWYLAIVCEVEDNLPCGNGEVGIDLGLKTMATLSTGDIVPALKHFRRYEAALSTARRANNMKRAKAIHAKIRNARHHHLHVQSTRIADQNSLIVVGNVKPAKLAKTMMAKSVMDAGWYGFKQMLRFKAARRQAVFVEVDEGFSSQTCSCCGTVPDSSPKGIGALGIRHWECSDCGASHDRDVNAARNILYVGLKRQPPVGGISLASGRR